MEVEVIHVDKFQKVHTLRQSDDIIGVYRILSLETGIRSDSLVLYTSEGHLLNQTDRFSDQIGGSSKIFLFRKDFVNFECDTLDIKDSSPLGSPEAKQFKELVPQNHPDFGKINEIGKKLFEQKEKAEKLLKNYLDQKKKFENLNEQSQIRLEASEAILKNLKNYKNKVKTHWKLQNQKMRSFQGKTNNLFDLFKSKLEEIKSAGLGTEVDEIFRQNKMKGFGDTVYSKVSTFCTKMQKLADVFKRVKKLIKESDESFENVSKKNDEVAFSSDYSILANQEGHFYNLNIMDEIYNEFNDCYSMALAQASQSEKNKSIGKLFEFKQNTEENEHILRSLQNTMSGFQKLSDHSKRIWIFFKNKVILTSVTVVSDLKFQVSEKLDKMQDRYLLLKKLTSFFKIPLKLVDSCAAARLEIQNSHVKFEEIRKMYTDLCMMIISDSNQRKAFLEENDSLLPEEMFGHLTQPVLNRSHLRQLLMFPDQYKEVLVEELQSYSNQELINYYEGKLGRIEREYSEEIAASKLKEKKLEDHLAYLLSYKQKLTNSALSQHELLKKYSIELQPLRNFESERKIKQFQVEVNNLKEKEEAFKRIHLANLKYLKEENKSLRERSSLTR